MKDFFISYNSIDENWAEWIGWQLEEAGYSVVIQAWDFKAGQNFGLEMHKASIDCNHTIAVLSQSYLDALFTQPEWLAAFIQDPIGNTTKLIPIRVQSCDPKGLLKAIIYIDLVDLNEEDAKDRLLTKIKTDRSKPTKQPVFPGESKIKVEPEFPGTKDNIKNKQAKLESKHDNKDLRDTPAILSKDDVKSMIMKHAFYCKRSATFGTFRYFNHQAKIRDFNFKEFVDINGDKIIIDNVSGLMWQRDGSSEVMSFENAKIWITDLNAKGFYGYHDWRIPTLEEAMMLMNSKIKKGLYIDPLFNKRQYRIWSSDESENRAFAWVVYYNYGFCRQQPVLNSEYVRAIRSI